MKRFLSFLATLCLFLKVLAQEKIEDKGIKTGQAVPDVLITGVSGLNINGQEVSSFRLSQLRGKLVVLDFWATWCAPCRKMAPVLDSLQRVFGDKVVFIQVGYESRAVITPVIAAMQRIKPFQLPAVYSDKVLNNLFPHRSLPHFVWIDPQGRVAAITEEKEVTASTIMKLLAGNGSAVARKQDLVLAYDREKPLFIGNNGMAGVPLRYHSVLTAYVPGLRAGMDMYPPDSLGSLRSNVRNVPLSWLFRMAYSDHNRWFSGSTMRYLVADTSKFSTHLSGQDYEDWLSRGNGWCYELLVPAGLADRSFTMMQQDISRLFPQYRLAVENTKTHCLALVRTSSADKLHTAGGEGSVAVGPFACELRNASLAQLIKRLQVQYLEHLPIPVVDETGYTAPVDLELRAPLSDVAALNRELARYDLKFIEKDAFVDLLVIRDNPAHP